MSKRLKISGANPFLVFLDVPVHGLNLFERWNYPANDAYARAAAEYVERVCANWSIERRTLLLQAAECIARAEQVKKSKRSATVVQARRELRVAKGGTAAARLVSEVVAMFPPPWTGDKAPVAQLITNLSKLINGALQAPIDFAIAKDSARRSAADAIRELGARPAFELLRDLVFLASGKTVEVSERTVRRYQSLATNPPRPLSRGHWTRNWRLLQSIAPYVLAAKAQTAGGSEQSLQNAVDRYLSCGSAPRLLDVVQPRVH